MGSPKFGRPLYETGIIWTGIYDLEYKHRFQDPGQGFVQDGEIGFRKTSALAKWVKPLKEDYADL